MNNWLPPTPEELLDEFSSMEDWDERYEYLVELGRELPGLESAMQGDEHLVKGCMSTVWLVVQPEQASNGQRVLRVFADSDSLIVKGLIVVLLAYFSGKTPEAMLRQNPEGLFQQLGLGQHLSPQRRNGLFAMVQRIRQLATEDIARAGE